ncbi:MAG: hypothetical protein BWX56_00616 [Euryarchaeota archaeon ADurb.Bin023]|nr:MAG: hypothetical protein BWX56_00616 [Euryarchaeota archaeon ADurb.Bin023]
MGGICSGKHIDSLILNGLNSGGEGVKQMFYIYILLSKEENLQL